LNFLVDNLPKKIEIEGKIYDIDYSYRNCLMIILAWEDEELTLYEKAEITINRLYCKIPDNLQIAINKAILFLNCGENIDAKGNEKRIYSFEKDSKYIYSAIDSATNGKLSENSDMHWWLFCMAFLEISEKSFFSRMIYMRTQKNKGKLTKEEKEFWRKNKDVLELDTNISPLEIATEEEIRNMEEFDRRLAKAKAKAKEKRNEV
jgi:hypothetical protein